MSVPPEILRQLLDYDPDTGALTWRPRPESMFSDGGRGAPANASRWNLLYAGREALTADDGKGYRAGRIFGRTYLSHRVVWALHHGNWPADQIDHINGNRSDNRIINLRAATRQENGRNQRRPATNTSGATGVCWHKRENKWLANIRAGGCRKHLGYFTDFESAVAARKVAEAELGYHKNHGRTA